jgi:hypothetical protein
MSGDPSASSSSSKPFCVRSALEDQQRKFFDRIDMDLCRALSHMQSVLANLEASVGEWQAQATISGLLFTPVQLEEVASSMPFQLQNEEALVDWLIGLQPVARTRSARQALVSRYCEIAEMLHTLLQYIEVNITAVRKILKKFEKKVPAEFRARNAQSYKAHHDLLSMDLQNLIVVMVHMHRLAHDAKALDAELKVDSTPASPISFVGVETLQVLQKIRGPQELHDLLSGQPAARSIDVFAKPNTDMEGGNANASTAAPGNVKNAASTPSLMSQQAAANIGNTDLFQGPPKASGGNATAATGTATSGQATSGTSQISPWARPPGQCAGNAPANNGKGNPSQSGRGGGRGSGAAGQEQAGKGGNKRGRGNRGQRGANTGQPLQGSNGNGRAQNERQTNRTNNRPSISGSDPGMDLFAANDSKAMLGYPQGKGSQNAMNNMSCMMPGMFMMVPTGWAGGPPGSWKGSGGAQMGMATDPHMMSPWHSAAIPQEWNRMMPKPGQSNYSDLRHC